MNCADQWQLRVAEHKCLVLSHGNLDPPGYYLKDVNLDNVDYHKDLGVIVDNNCLFKQHVSYINCVGKYTVPPMFSLDVLTPRTLRH